MSLTFAVEPLEQCWDEGIALAAAHWAEKEQHRHGTFNPSFDRYQRYEQAGWFVMCTARDAGRMVGYAGFYVTPSMHTQELTAVEDTVFLLPAYRKGSAGIRFIKFVEAQMVRVAEAAGQSYIEITATAHRTNAVTGKLLEYLDYTAETMQYMKRLPVVRHSHIGADSSAIAVGVGSDAAR